MTKKTVKIEKNEDFFIKKNKFKATDTISYEFKPLNRFFVAPKIVCGLSFYKNISYNYK